MSRVGASSKAIYGQDPNRPTCTFRAACDPVSFLPRFVLSAGVHDSFDTARQHRTPAVQLLGDRSVHATMLLSSAGHVLSASCHGCCQLQAPFGSYRPSAGLRTARRAVEYDAAQVPGLRHTFSSCRHLTAYHVLES